MKRSLATALTGLTSLFIGCAQAVPVTIGYEAVVTRAGDYAGGNLSPYIGTIFTGTFIVDLGLPQLKYVKEGASEVISLAAASGCKTFSENVCVEKFPNVPHPILSASYTGVFGTFVASTSIKDEGGASSYVRHTKYTHPTGEVDYSALYVFDTYAPTKDGARSTFSDIAFVSTPLSEKGSFYPDFSDMTTGIEFEKVEDMWIYFEDRYCQYTEDGRCVGKPGIYIGGKVTRAYYLPAGTPVDVPEPSSTGLLLLGAAGLALSYRRKAQTQP